MLHSPQVDSIVSDLVDRVRYELGETRLYGIYLYGSLASSGFDEQRSDIDVLVAITIEVDIADLHALETMHLKFARDCPGWRDRIDVQYVSIDALRHFKTRDSRIASISPGEPLHLIMAGRDWMQNWYDVQENGRTLCGPDRRTIVPPISAAEFRAAIRRYVRELLGRIQTHPGGRAYIVLTMCRALHSCETGRQISKVAAAAWAQDRLPGWREIVSQALRIRGGEREESLEHAAEFVDQADQFIRLVADRVLAD